ncbi:uncharacterized protein LOC143230198 isoform X3 [Tachypleus tridentatus]|uniref:uncharacterized protein LOC143230198 isoform X3 n=1 Tax=Tachypleus tridentatus TaxID=6853 RepID=UPI003FD0A554
MKKRKELDALVSNGKLVKRVKKPASSGSASAHELLGNFSDTSDIDDSSALRSQRVACKKSSTLASCLPLCLIVLVSTSVVTAGTWIWLHLGLRQDLDLLRDHIQTVEASNKNTPETLHSIHSQLKEFEKNVSILGADLQNVISEISVLGKEVEHLKETAGGLKESIAAASEIKELPKDVSLLSENVASFGSKITAMEATMKDMKHQQASLQTSQEGLKQSLTNFQVQIQALSNVTEKLSSSSREDQTAKLTKEQHIFHDELLRVSEAIDNINITTLPIMLKIKEILPLLERVNGSATRNIENLNSFYVNLAIRDMLNNTLSVGNMSNTNITLTEILKQTQDVIHTYLELIQQLKDPVDNHLLNRYSNATNVVGQLLSTTISSLLKDHERELKTLQNNVSYLLTQYTQLKSAQVATEHKINSVVANLQLVETLTPMLSPGGQQLTDICQYWRTAGDFQNTSEVTDGSTETYSGSLGKGSSRKNNNRKRGIFKKSRFQPPTP